jgi:hypothetical protein
MTDRTSIPVEDLPAAADTTRRDRWGRYLVVPPGGKDPTGYTRVTTIAKTLDQGGGLAPWKAAMAMQGLVLRRGLRAQLEALMAQYNGDPWYSGEEGKKAIKELVEDAAAVGGANDRREMGSALHTITALVDLGRQPALTDESRADMAAYQATLDAHGMQLYKPWAVEVPVVLHQFTVAGTLDRIVTVPGYDKPLIADIKTGASLEYSWQDIAVQLAAYANADAIYRQGAKADGSEDSTELFPDVDKEWGLVIWLKAGQAECEIIAVDLGQGWLAFKEAMWVRGWRNSKLTKPLDLTPILQTSVTNIEAIRQVVVAFPGTTDFRAELQERITKIGEGPHREEFMRVWKASKFRSLKTHTDHTADELSNIKETCELFENQRFFNQPTQQPEKETP